jgi:hypothetical protein
MTITNNLSPSAIMDLCALHADVNAEQFRALTPQNGWLMADDMGMMVAADPRVAFTGLVEILMRQTTDERVNGGTCHKNKFGFSKKHVTRGTELAIKFLTGEELTTDDVTDAVKIATAYREQLWMVRLGAVPMNHLNLRPSRRQEPAQEPAASTEG